MFQYDQQLTHLRETNIHVIVFKMQTPAESFTAASSPNSRRIEICTS
jgi:hypothetical protein